MNKIESVASVATKSAPPVTVSVISFAGIPLQEWVYILTIGWIMWQLGCSIYDRWRK